MQNLKWATAHLNRRLRTGRTTGRNGPVARALGVRPGRAAGLWAVHLVHSACF